MQNRLVGGLMMACWIALVLAGGASAVDIPGLTSDPPPQLEGESITSNPVVFQRIMGGAPPTLCEPTGSYSQLKLWAGQHTDVGTLFIETYDYFGKTALRVTYDIKPGWYLKEYHLYVGSVIPPTSSPGEFPFKGDHVNTSYLVVDHDLLGYPILYDGYMNADDCVFIAAHGVVKGYADFDLGDFNNHLPTCADVTVHPEPADGEAYFGVDVLDTNLAGDDYDAWCLDPNVLIDPKGVDYQTEVYPSIPDGAAGEAWVEHPENLDLVNWILNQGYVGAASPTPCTGDYTFGDVQLGIWKLIDDEPFSNIALNSLEDYDKTECRADSIVAMAMGFGEGYMPDCGGYVGVILVPYEEFCGVGDPFQILIIPVPIECREDGSDTIWAKDKYDHDDPPSDCDFSDGWGSYFQFCAD